MKFIASRLKYDTRSIKLRGREFKAYIADSLLKQMIGLMYKKSIRSDECMLFDFNHDAEHGIWMKNMLFPIDVVWLDSKMRIIHIENRIQPCTKTFGCKTYNAGKNSRLVIEFRAGTAEKIRLKAGDALSYCN